MSADQLEQLLVVQSHDTTLRQLRHKREHLPERADLDTAQAELASVAAERGPIAESRAAVALEQSKLEDEAMLVEQKVTRENDKLYSGTVTGAKDLQALQDEIASLKRHQTSIEDRVIEQMELGEPLDETIADLDSRSAEIQGRIETVEAAIAAAEAEIDGEIAGEQGRRDAAAAGIDGALLERYDAIRSAVGGIGIARFVGGRCEGCHLSLSAVEADQVKKAPADEVLTCSSCERILVR